MVWLHKHTSVNVMWTEAPSQLVKLQVNAKTFCSVYNIFRPPGNMSSKPSATTLSATEHHPGNDPRHLNTIVTNPVTPVF